MSKFIFPAAVIFLALLAFRSPVTRKVSYSGLDTLKFYSVNLDAETKGNRSTYKVNGKTVDKATYDKYKSVWDNIKNCTPCYLKTYDADDHLLYEGDQYEDCAVGNWKEYYPDGKVKIIGHYLENHTGNWKNIYARGFCSVKDGTWLSLSPTGDTTKVEVYSKGKLVGGK